MFGQSGFRPLMGELRLKSVQTPGLGQAPGSPAPSNPVPGPASATVTPTPAPVVPIDSGLSQNAKLLLGGTVLAAIIGAIFLD